MIIVSDTSPIANLTVVGQIHLLPRLFNTITIPDTVYQELLANGANHPVSQLVQAANWLEIRCAIDRQQVKLLEKDRNLDPGEANAIVLALELNAAQLLMDERLGRAEAKRQGIRITGILGILLVAKRQALIPEIGSIMDALISQANFRISKQLYIEALQLSGELS